MVKFWLLLIADSVVRLLAFVFISVIIVVSVNCFKLFNDLIFLLSISTVDLIKSFLNLLNCKICFGSVAFLR